MMRATILVGDDATVETAVHPCGRGTLTVWHHGGTVRVESLDPAMWERIAHAAQALSRDHVAALSPPPRREMIP